MKHCMLDLETWGLAPGSALRSIGAFMFDPFQENRFGEAFYCNVSKDSCLGWGLTVDPKTEEWWMQQSAEARSALEAGQVGLTSALGMFTDWWTHNEAEYVWAHGAAFDPVILECAYKRLAGQAVAIPPWNYRNVFDTRTVFFLGEVDLKKQDRSGPEHHALHDAINQARAVQRAVANLRQHTAVA